MRALAAILKWCLEYWYVVALAALIGGLAWWGQSMRGERDALRAEYAEFRRDVARAAQAAAEQALKTTIANEERREKADAENARTVARLRADAVRMRRERDDARRSFLSAAPAGSKCPDGQACFDRGEFERAYGALIGAIREGADECTEMSVDLNTARRWAVER